MAGFVEYPLLSVLLQEKELVRKFSGVSLSSLDDLTNKNYRPSEFIQGDTLPGVLSLPPKFSDDGNLLCLTMGNILKIMDGSLKNNSVLAEIPCDDPTHVEFSPKGTFIVTFSRLLKNDDNQSDNVKVWNIQTREVVYSFKQKIFKNNSIQWSENEHLFFRLVTNEVQILNGKVFAGEVKYRIRCPNVTQFKISGKDEFNGRKDGAMDVCMFAASHGGNNAQLFIHQVKNSCRTTWWPSVSDNISVVGPVVSRSCMSNASECVVTWNYPLCNVAAVTVHCDVDSSGTSYYGTTSAYLLAAGTDSSQTAAAAAKLTDKNPTSVAASFAGLVAQTKTGPIHDIKWSPSGIHFVLIAGSMPAAATLFNIRGEALYEFGAFHRNTVSWSPHGRFFCIAGLGNLAGEADFYEINVENKNKIKKIGSADLHCTVNYGWSPDSRFFMSSTLAPRMNVDNGFKIYKYNGEGPIFQYECNSSLKNTASSLTEASGAPQPSGILNGNKLAYSCQWRVVPSIVYPNRCRSPNAKGSEVVETVESVKPPPVTKAAPAPYRPPGSSGAFAEMLRSEKSSGPTGKVATPAPQTVKPAASAPTAAKPGTGKYKPPTRPIPGMATITAATAKTKI